MREISPKRALVNAVLALGVLALTVWGVVKVAQRHWIWQETFRAEADFARIGGLALGDKVRLQGMEAGVVEWIRPPQQPGGPIRVGLLIDARLRPLIRSDAVATIGMQNAVGPKVIEIAPGKPDAAPLPVGGSLRTTNPVELGDLILAGNDALGQLTGLTREAEQGLKEVNAIAASVNRGEGTLGKLVRDDAAYRQFMSLAERGERAVTSLDDNLAAIKGFWPMSGYMKDRGLDDPDRLLYRPNSARDDRVFATADLFQPGTAILTDSGRAHLESYAQEFKGKRWPESAEVVIAAFVGSTQDEAAARVLTQDQAKAVRSYFEQKHKLFDLAFFRQRKVASVGFGTKAPRPDPAAGATADREPPPPDRVEVVVFTPKS